MKEKFKRLIKPSSDNEFYYLTSPVALPKAFGFLWNNKMVIQANCRGYATAQFTQPEPYKYAHSPNLEAKTFIQPEQPYYAHHPGRFVYIKNEDNEIFSVPYEPVKVKTDEYLFSVGKDSIKWEVTYDNIYCEMSLSLSKNDTVELWSIKVKNLSDKRRKISIYPYFPVGYMSWMNQSSDYNEELQSIICSSITPYQKSEDYYKLKDNKDKTYLMAEKKPYSWDGNQEVFEGEGGLIAPDAVVNETLLNSKAHYEMPTCALQYVLNMNPQDEETFRFIFGPAKDDAEIANIRNKYFINKDKNGLDGFQLANNEYKKYISEGKGCIEVNTPDKEFDNFVNSWLPRQMYYHGITNRLATDPQTRNYLQDSMGMSYINPDITRSAFIFAMAQQNTDGSMPDGVLLKEGIELKYINQIPHSDHCVWLSLCVSVYLAETNDYALLDELVGFADSDEKVSVFEHINISVDWLFNDRDKRGLNYIRQGDWCDPMNMVGINGKGVSAWLTIATSYCLRLWSDICKNHGYPDLFQDYFDKSMMLNELINEYFWDGDWYARGITDDGVTFGISTDVEGKIYLNPQGWALLSGATDKLKESKLIKSVENYLESPYGVETLSPSYTHMREDVGRLTQKYPGNGENGSVYNHAATFYIYSLYSIGQKEKAFELLRKMLPSNNLEDIIRRGQLPVYIPNYYRGAYRQIPEKAGRSSHMFNTGTISWFYRCVVEGLFGLKGTTEGLIIQPKMPKEWENTNVKRFFRGATFNIEIKKNTQLGKNEIFVNNVLIEGDTIKNIVSGVEYNVLVLICE